MSNLSFRIRKNAPLSGVSTVFKRGQRSQYEKCEFEKMEINDSICLKTLKVGASIDPKERLRIYYSVRRVIVSRGLKISDFKFAERPMSRNVEFCIYKVK